MLRLARPTRLLRPVAVVTLLMTAVPACMDSEVEDGEHDAFPSGKADGGLDEGSPEALGVLRLVNDPQETGGTLRAGAGITARAANNIVTHRNGADGAPGTADDDAFDTLAELDAIPYVGPATLNALGERARDKGYIAGTRHGRLAIDVCKVRDDHDEAPLSLRLNANPDLIAPAPPCPGTECLLIPF